VVSEQDRQSKQASDARLFMYARAIAFRKAPAASLLPASCQPRGQSSTTDPIVEPIAALRLGRRVRGKLFDGREVDRRDARCCRLGE
jgi:hypothetical protein